MKITITIEEEDIDWVCHYALRNVNVLTDNSAQIKRIDRIRKAIAFAKIDSQEVLTKAHKSETITQAQADIIKEQIHEEIKAFTHSVFESILVLTGINTEQLSLIKMEKEAHEKNNPNGK